MIKKSKLDKENSFARVSFMKPQGNACFAGYYRKDNVLIS